MTQSNPTISAELQKQIEDEALEVYPGFTYGDKRAIYIAGATAYALKLQQAEDRIKQLEQWQREATLVIDPIIEYGQNHPDIKLGSSITSFVIERCKRYDQAEALLEKFISSHEAGLLPDRHIYNEIKTFLDGSK